jgi:hypothetical protein
MTTLKEMIEVIRAENPNGLQIGDEENGYTQLSAPDYEAQIAQWAQGRLDKEAKLAEAESVAQAKLDAVDKLTALGIDPKALGLVIEEKPVKK